MVLLAVFWIFFGLLHSVLAAGGVKVAVQKLMGRYFKYYTFIYSIIATVSLAGVLIYQFSLPPNWLWYMPRWAMLLMIVPVAAGLFIMMALIKKYFFALSGISAFYKEEAPVNLELGGWHRYMRHPLYFGTLLFVWSLFFMFPTAANLVACSIITLYTIVGTILEEKKLVAQFGTAYSNYQQNVPMLIPYKLFSTRKYNRGGVPNDFKKV